MRRSCVQLLNLAVRTAEPSGSAVHTVSGIAKALPEATTPFAACPKPLPSASLAGEAGPGSRQLMLRRAVSSATASRLVRDNTPQPDDSRMCFSSQAAAEPLHHRDAPYPMGAKSGLEQSGKASEAVFDGEHVNIGNEVDKLLLLGAEKEGVSGVLKVVRDHGLTFNEVNMRTAFEQLAKLSKGLPREEVEAQVIGNKTFNDLTLRVIETVEDFHAKNLTEIIECCGKLRYENLDLLDAISRHLVSKADAMSAKEISELVGGLAIVDHSPSVVLFDALSARVKQIGSEFTDKQRKIVEDGFKELGYEGKSLA